MHPHIKRAEVLSPSQIRHLLRVTDATSRHPARDAVVLLLGLACGMRLTEIAQVTVADFYFASGELRREVSLRRLRKDADNAAFIHRRPKLLLRWAATFRTGANGRWEQQWAARIITV
jgi:integrase